MFLFTSVLKWNVQRNLVLCFWKCKMRCLGNRRISWDTNNIKCSRVLSVTVRTRALNIKMRSWDCNLEYGEHHCHRSLTANPRQWHYACCKHSPSADSAFVSPRLAARMNVESADHLVFTGHTLLPHAPALRGHWGARVCCLWAPALLFWSSRV